MEKKTHFMRFILIVFLILCQSKTEVHKRWCYIQEFFFLAVLYQKGFDHTSN